MVPDRQTGVATVSLHGWIILDKPLGLGSTAAVSAVKRALRDGDYPRAKVGHGGTLDPLATGVLPIAIGEATKLCGRMLDASKVYRFTIRFGIGTDTLDTEGTVVARSAVVPAPGAVAAILPRFTGAIDQVPPAYSALKIDGERSYDLARRGDAAPLASRSVHIHSLAVVAEAPGEATLCAHVSKGTYIRSLARDVAQTLGTVGHVSMLRRTRAGPFGLDDAISLDFLAEKARDRALEDIILPLRAALADIPAIALTPEQAGLVRQGRVLTGIAAEDGIAFAMLDKIPVALVDCRAGNLRVERGFNL